ncbi:MAG: hypothetical protein PHW76_07375 [Alphaproteobacteria bacterium]|nr:hypothetical protein [Alphaproteobacteria bacterium]
MFSPLSAVGAGLYQAVARATQCASNVVNGSSTGENLDEGLVELQESETDVGASAAALKAAGKMQKALLDILA